jgi:hypothetical protein
MQPQLLEGSATSGYCSSSPQHAQRTIVGWLQLHLEVTKLQAVEPQLLRQNAEKDGHVTTPKVKAVYVLIVLVRYTRMPLICCWETCVLMLRSATTAAWCSLL